MPIEAANLLEFNRRRFVAYLSSAGLGATLMPGALTAVAQESQEITAEMVSAAARVSGLSFSDEELKGIVEGLNGRFSFRRAFDELRSSKIENFLQPALVFNPVPSGMRLPTEMRPVRPSDPHVSKPASDEDLAFLPVTHLARLIRERQITSTELTRLYLARLQKYDPILHCVVNLTEDLALRQAGQADEEIAAGRYRGPLHGVPWGAKDLLAVKGYPTTFGASPYKEQVIDQDATVYQRLTEAGAVLVAKLSMGALAQGDRWFGGLTRNPWNTEQGSSGSSAGPGSATAAGLVGFSIGTETRGSIISPSTRCGVTGLRPTFGRVSRHGAMALSWSMDKIGPMCRSAEDCMLVLQAIHGPDGLDNSLIDAPLNWDCRRELSTLRVGYLKSSIEREIPDLPDNPQRAQSMRESQEHDRRAVETFRSMGFDLKEIELPDLPTRALGFILTAEAAAAFDDLTRSDLDDLMAPEPESSRWPEAFRLHRFVPAVEYIQANRVRSRLIEELHRVFADLDLFIGSDLGLTNLTGHPEICFPHGFSQGSPTAFRLTGKLFGEEELVLAARAFQERTDYHNRKPPLPA